MCANGAPETQNDVLVASAHTNVSVSSRASGRSVGINLSVCLCASVNMRVSGAGA